MITPQQMLQEAIEELNSLSIDELEIMFKEVGLDVVSKENEDYASLTNSSSN